MTYAPPATAESPLAEAGTEAATPVARSAGSRAEALRRWAADVPEPLAVALRRRAAELELIAAACDPLRVAA